ncbi:hypothetical protein BCO26_2199 [Heyndrickxia coagulans 2-6]|nr:hypothetical protein BCO26_2199 [Heyndrickxia coagulans 2-6]
MCSAALISIKNNSTGQVRLRRFAFKRPFCSERGTSGKMKIIQRIFLG